MIRLIKRYESRKLYDTEESRYVSLEEIADWIRHGQDVRVVENATAADVTAQTLTQIILDQGKQGRSGLSADLLHELVRLGERAWTSGLEQVQQGVDRLLESSFHRLGPVRRAREEMSRLRGQLRELERSLAALESQTRAEIAAGARAEGASPKPAGRSGRRRGAAEKPLRRPRRSAPEAAPPPRRRRRVAAGAGGEGEAGSRVPAQGTPSPDGGGGGGAN